MIDLTTKTARRRALAAGAGLMVTGIAGPTAQAAEPTGPHTAGLWPGLGVMKGTSRGYVTTPMGQVHYISQSPADGGGRPLVLLHQSPWFSIQFAKVLPLLAARGFAAVAPDRPGFGMSDVPDTPPTVEDYADNLADTLDALGIEQAAVVGHHTGSGVAVALAHRHPGKVSRLVLDGVPFYTAEQRAQRLARPHWDRWLEPDGAHLKARFDARANSKGRQLRAAGVDTGQDRAWLAGVQWSVMSLFLAGETEWYGHNAAFSYDMTDALGAIAAPTLIVSYTEDALYEMNKRAHAARPDFEMITFEGGHAQMPFDEPEHWVDAVAPFLEAG
jgi:pimeloyl-ACP methyl ester carboxylesterase